MEKNVCACIHVQEGLSDVTVGMLADLVETAVTGNMSSNNCSTCCVNRLVGAYVGRQPSDFIPIQEFLDEFSGLLVEEHVGVELKSVAKRKIFVLTMTIPFDTDEWTAEAIGKIFRNNIHLLSHPYYNKNTALTMSAHH